jgi:hypothetical protein
VVVRVYNTAAIDAALKARALKVAGATIGETSIDLAWVECSGPAVAPRCASPVTGRELVVRLVHQEATKRRGAASASLSSFVTGNAAHRRKQAEVPLGEALIDGERYGVLATVYVNRVATLAAATGADLATLLGRTIAHEIGHLLLASNEHATHGLMRAVWSFDEIRRDRAEDWRFTSSPLLPRPVPR